jgi:hypothetical protein
MHTFYISGATKCSLCYARIWWIVFVDLAYEGEELSSSNVLLILFVLLHNMMMTLFSDFFIILF